MLLLYPKMVFSYPSVWQAVNKAASEWSEKNENPDNFDTEGSVGLTSKVIYPNRGEKTALGNEREIKGGRTWIV